MAKNTSFYYKRCQFSLIFFVPLKKRVYFCGLLAIAAAIAAAGVKT
ncbi:MAG: hypothetical protein IKB11_02415 [Bacteroidaceae bacterium]|nr:hypothetical protein [Bacteroidaceae bacterium]